MTLRAAPWLYNLATEAKDCTVIPCRLRPWRTVTRVTPYAHRIYSRRAIEEAQQE